MLDYVPIDADGLVVRKNVQRHVGAQRHDAPDKFEAVKVVRDYRQRGRWLVCGRHKGAVPRNRRGGPLGKVRVVGVLGFLLGDCSSLRILGSVGEPINPEAWQWYHQVRAPGMLAGLCPAWPPPRGCPTQGRMLFQQFMLHQALKVWIIAVVCLLGVARHWTHVGRWRRA